MAYIDYPIKCIAADGYNENPERGSTLHRAEDGTPWIVNLWPETQYTFEIRHPALSSSEQLELEQFYDQHIGDEVGWDNPRRQERWIVRMVGPPRLAGMRDGLRGDVEMTLVGYRGVAPTYSVPPVVSGLHQIGQELAVSQGTWQSEYPMQFEYQWLRNGEPIAGATDQNYTLVDDDLFDMISVRVTASSLGGSTSVETEPVRARLDSEVSWLYSDMAETIFVDVDGNTPATWGDPVGLIKDSSGNGNDFTQPTVTARPILGRVPRGGRRNEWDRSDNMVAPGVQMHNITITPDEESGAFRATATNDTGIRQFYRTFPANRLTQYSLVVKAGSIGEVSLLWSSVALGSFDLLTGEATGDTALMTSLGDGWWRISASGYLEAESYRGWALRLPDSAVTGDYVLVKNPQVEEPLTQESPPTPYQRVTTPYDITEEGVPDVYYLNFDLTDDNLTTTLPAIENGTVVIAGTNGIWIDDDYNFDGGTFSIGTTSYTGGPEGILTAIGEPITGGLLVINRQLTQLERDLVIQEMREHGAPEELIP